jgi:hypothetical protein
VIKLPLALAPARTTAQNAAAQRRVGRLKVRVRFILRFFSSVLVRTC